MEEAMGMRMRLSVACTMSATILAVCSTSLIYVPKETAAKGTSVHEARRVVRQIVLQPAPGETLTYCPPEGRRCYDIGEVHAASRRLTLRSRRDEKHNEEYDTDTFELRTLEPRVFQYFDFFAGCGGTKYNTMRLGKGEYPHFILPSGTGRPEATARRLADALLVLKQAALDTSAAQEQARFEEAAKSYRAAVSKPALPEEAQRYKTQAEAAVRDKDFDDAADLYEQALELAPWWAEGHFNRGVVLGELEEYDAAIVEMRRYLMLLPDAPNARTVQDRIYEWERRERNQR